MRKPDDIRASNDHVHLVNLEAIVDEAIDRASMFGHWPAKCMVGAYPGKLVAQIVNRYKDNGWRVDYLYDIAGNFLVIHEP